MENQINAETAGTVKEIKVDRRRHRRHRRRPRRHRVMGWRPAPSAARTRAMARPIPGARRVPHRGVARLPLVLDRLLRAWPTARRPVDVDVGDPRRRSRRRSARASTPGSDGDCAGAGHHARARRGRPRRHADRRGVRGPSGSRPLATSATRAFAVGAVCASGGRRASTAWPREQGRGQSTSPSRAVIRDVHCDAATHPNIATPTAPPTCRVVSFMAEPTPAFSRGSAPMIDSVAGATMCAIPTPSTSVTAMTWTTEAARHRTSSSGRARSRPRASPRRPPPCSRTAPRAAATSARKSHEDHHHREADQPGLDGRVPEHRLDVLREDEAHPEQREVRRA